MRVLCYLAEWLEDLSLVFSTDTGAFIPNLEHHDQLLVPLPIYSVRPEAHDFHLSVLRTELDCVGQNVEHDLLDAISVSNGLPESDLVQVDLNLDILRVGLCLHELTHLPDDISNCEPALT